MKEKRNWFFWVLIIISIWFWRDHHKLTNQIELLREESYEFERKTRFYSDALDQANSNIEDAQSYAWESYDEMGYALDSLETVEP